MSTPEDIYEDGKRQDREDRLEREREDRLRREPPIGEPCGECEGEGFTNETFPPSECPRCEGMGSV